MVMAPDKPKMYYAGSLPWQGIGADVRDETTVEGALHKAGLDWEVALGQVWAGPQQMLLKDRKAIYRTSDGRVFGITASADGYSPIQNAKAWEFMNGLLKDRTLQLETSGQLMGGKRIWMLARLDEDIEINGDAHIPYLLGVTGHDLVTSFKVFPTLVRVVCQNTMMKAIHIQEGGQGPAQSKMARIVHTGDIDSKLSLAAQVLQVTTAQMRRYSEWLQQMAETELTPIQTEAIQTAFVGSADNDTAAVRRHAIEKFEAIYEAEKALHGATAYSMVQAVTGYSDHSIRVQTTAGGGERMVSALFGRINLTKQRGLDAIERILDDGE